MNFTSKSPVDKLPDEILLQILRDALTLLEPMPLWLEHSIYLPRHFIKNYYKDDDWRSSAHYQDSDTAIYSLSTVKQRLSSGVHPSQEVHQRDWLVINATCRRFRSLGKPIFFSTRSLAVTFNDLQRLESSCSSWMNFDLSQQKEAWQSHRRYTVAALTDTIQQRLANHEDLGSSERWCAFSPEDQRLALANMEQVTLLGLRWASASAMLKLPTIVVMLPRLKKCTLLMGVLGGNYISLYSTHGPGHSKSGTGATVTELTKLLVAIGLSGKLGVELGLVKNTDWNFHKQYFTESLYPMLRFKAQLVAKSKGTPTGNKISHS